MNPSEYDRWWRNRISKEEAAWRYHKNHAKDGFETVVNTMGTTVLAPALFNTCNDSSLLGSSMLLKRDSKYGDSMGLSPLPQDGSNQPRSRPATAPPPEPPATALMLPSRPHSSLRPTHSNANCHNQHRRRSKSKQKPAATSPQQLLPTLTNLSLEGAAAGTSRSGSRPASRASGALSAASARSAGGASAGSGTTSNLIMSRISRLETELAHERILRQSAEEEILKLLQASLSSKGGAA